MSYYWYVAQTNELFIDLDHHEDDAELGRLKCARDRLFGAIKAGVIHVRDTYLFPSDTDRHYHLIVVLADGFKVDSYTRRIWEGYLRDDPYRNLNNLMRTACGITSSLLITSKAYPEFRAPDAECQCDKKHTNDVMVSCKTAAIIRKSHASKSYFGKSERLTLEIKMGRWTNLPTKKE